MKNQNKTTRPANDRRLPITTLRPPREAYRLMLKAPHHDLLVLSFYPGMGGNGAHADHPTAA